MAPMSATAFAMVQSSLCHPLVVPHTAAFTAARPCKQTLRPTRHKAQSGGASIPTDQFAPSLAINATQPVTANTTANSPAPSTSTELHKLDSAASQSATAGTAPSSATASTTPEADKPGILSRIKRLFLGDSKLDRQRLAALGFGAFAAYGVISNINAGVLFTISWITIVKQTGLTPLAGASQWAKFLAVYAGLWVGSNFLRPIRLSLALAAAPVFDAVLTGIQTRLRLNKAAAFGVMIFCIAAFTITGFVSALLFFGGFPQGLFK